MAEKIMACRRCGGEGVVAGPELCPVCEGSGLVLMQRRADGTWRRSEPAQPGPYLPAERQRDAPRNPLLMEAIR
jgi:RecJ-like exonuclease